MNERVATANLTRRIAEILGQSIVAGKYSGRPFPIEANLCTQFNASRSVVREAVKMLTAKGLLRSRSRQGTSVQPEAKWNLLDPDVLRWLLERPFSLDLLAEFTEMRRAIEPAAAAMAARRRDTDAIAVIADALDRMRAADNGDGDALASDIAFHVAILDASGNRFYSNLRDLTETALRISIGFTNQFKNVEMGSIEDHELILAAIARGDAPAAAHASQVLIDEAMTLIHHAHEAVMTTDEV